MPSQREDPIGRPYEGAAEALDRAHAEPRATVRLDTRGVRKARELLASTLRARLAAARGEGGRAGGDVIFRVCRDATARFRYAPGTGSDAVAAPRDRARAVVVRVDDALRAAVRELEGGGAEAADRRLAACERDVEHALGRMPEGTRGPVDADLARRRRELLAAGERVERLRARIGEHLDGPGHDAASLRGAVAGLAAERDRLRHAIAQAAHMRRELSTGALMQRTLEQWVVEAEASLARWRRDHARVAERVRALPDADEAGALAVELDVLERDVGPTEEEIREARRHLGALPDRVAGWLGARLRHVRDLEARLAAAERAVEAVRSDDGDPAAAGALVEALRRDAAAALDARLPDHPDKLCDLTLRGLVASHRLPGREDVAWILAFVRGAREGSLAARLGVLEERLAVRG